MDFREEVAKKSIAKKRMGTTIAGCNCADNNNIDHDDDEQFVVLTADTSTPKKDNSSSKDSNHPEPQQSFYDVVFTVYLQWQREHLQLCGT